MDTIGVICEPDHPVFGRVAERLAARGFGVEFLPPGESLVDARLDQLTALVNTVVTRRSFAALAYADRAGIETWNGFFPTTALSCRLVALHALERLGCRIPDTDRSHDERNTVARPRFRWDDAPVSENAVAEERLRSGATRARYYAVDDGVETHVQALTLRAHVTGQQRTITDTEVDVELATRVRELLGHFDARAVAVDFVEAPDQHYVVDVDPAPQFYEVGMERNLADSMASLTTIGA